MTFGKYCPRKVQKHMEEIIDALTLEDAVLESVVESPTEVAASDPENHGPILPGEVLIEVDVEAERVKEERRRTMCTVGFTLPGTKRRRDV